MDRKNQRFSTRVVGLPRRQTGDNFLGKLVYGSTKRGRNSLTAEIWVGREAVIMCNHADDGADYLRQTVAVLSCPPVSSQNDNKGRPAVIQLKPETPEELRKRLQEMSDLELRRFGQRARKLSDPKMNFGATQPHVIELEEARTEWRRRHPESTKR
jgi:hypothetical protein